jgi:hypothetical protein
MPGNDRNRKRADSAIHTNHNILLIVRVLFVILLSITIGSVSIVQAQDFTVWTESPSNPLFGGPTAGVDRAYYPSVLKVGSVYHIWYGDGSNTRHASSTRPDFSDVTFPAPVVTGLVTGVTYHPRVLYNASGWNIGLAHYAGPFLMYYVGANTSYFDGPPRVAYSADGNSWTDIGQCTIVTSYSTTYFYIFDVLYEGGTTWKAYGTDGVVNYFVSTDGINWTETAHDILGSQLQPWETSAFTPPHVIKSGGQYIMFYGSGGSGEAAIGVAFSTDGQNFTKSSSNPIFSTNGSPPAWRNDRTYTPYVMQDGTGWRMYYSGRNGSTGVYSVGFTDLNAPPPTTAIPAMNDCGKITFMILAGLGAILYLRQRKAES